MGRPAARVEDMLARERELWARGYVRIAGVDEVGRGPLAGPVTAGAVVLPPKIDLPGVRDSKTVPRGAREELAAMIRERALSVATASASPREIDRFGIARATWRAMEGALLALAPGPDFVLVDGRRIAGIAWPQEARPRADALSLSVAAASLVAKVRRDEIMTRLGRRYPEFGFDRHMGYGTREHLDALERLGPTPWHRRSFAWNACTPPGTAQDAPGAAVETTSGLGRRGEALAERWLVARGFRMVAKNFRAAGAEVDLIGWDQGELVFIEVKLRRGGRRGDAVSAVTPAKQRRLSRAASSFLSLRGLAGSRCRFDVVAISLHDRDSRTPRVDHYRNAFSGASESLW